MAEVYSHQEITTLGRKAKSLINDLKIIDAHIAQKNNVDRGCKDLAGAFNQAISGEVVNDFPFSHVLKFVNQALVFANDFTKFQISNEQNDHLKICRDNSIRKAERLDYWKLWSQRALRAVLSVAILVFVYSSLVWLSEHYSFIKIPIRDLVSNS